MKRPRLRKWAKWACTAAALLAAGIAIGSRFFWWRCVAFREKGTVLRMIDLGGGLLQVYDIHSEMAVQSVNEENTLVMCPQWSWGLSGQQTGPFVGGDWRWGVYYKRDSLDLVHGVSLLYPVVLTLIPTALLWHADRRPSGPDACKKCGYDRRDLAPDTACPECGTVPGSVWCGSGAGA
jgi:hypothetical protein